MSHDPVEIKPELSQQERELVVKTRNMIKRNGSMGVRIIGNDGIDAWVESNLRRMGAIR